MAAEVWILEALRTDPALSAQLARFDGQPAVFYQMAPPDTDPGWEGLQYPRMDLVVDWVYDPARQTDGRCAVNIWCLNTGQVDPEQLGEQARACLRDLFLTDAEGEVCALEWQRTDAFEAGGQDSQPLRIGVTLTLDLLAFPAPITVEPDPVAGLCDLIKGQMPAARVAGLDAMERICRPTAEQPILYVRMSGEASAMHNSWAVAWMDVTLQVHIFAPGAHQRQLLCRTLCSALAREGECKLRDGSPMLLRRVALTASANPLRQGQLAVTGRYGLPWHPPEVPKQKYIQMKGEF